MDTISYIRSAGDFNLSTRYNLANLCHETEGWFDQQFSNPAHRIKFSYDLIDIPQLCEEAYTQAIRIRKKKIRSDYIRNAMKISGCLRATSKYRKDKKHLDDIAKTQKLTTASGISEPDISAIGDVSVYFTAQNILLHKRIAETAGLIRASIYYQKYGKQALRVNTFA